MEDLMMNLTLVPANCTQEIFQNTTYCIQLAQYTQDIAFATAVVTNVILFVVFGALFLIFRMLDCCKPVYTPMNDVEKPGKGCFAWLTAAWKIQDSEIELKRGLDTLMYLKFLKYMFWITTSYLAYGVILLITHANAGGGLTGTSVISMSNVPDNSPYFAADLIGVYLNSICAFFGIYKLYQLYVHLRIRSKRKNYRPENYVVIVREFDKFTTEHEIYTKFNKIFPGKVAFVRKAYVSRGIRKHLKWRQKMGTKHEDFAGHYKKKGKKKNATDLKPFYCIGGNKVDGIEFFAQRYQEESAIVEEKIAKIADPTKAKHFTGVAFVTFKDRATAQMAAQCTLCEGKLAPAIGESWVVDPAPAPKSVMWNALHTTHMLRWVKSLFVNIGTFFLIFFWMIPVALAAGLANITFLIQILPFLEPVINAAPIVRAFLEGFLPSLVYIIFFAILVKYIITPMAMAEGQWSMAVVKRSIFNKYFLFLIFNIFLGTAFVSGIFQVLGDIIENPAGIADLLATSLPAQAPIFITYVMILSLSGQTMALWRPGAGIGRYIIQKWIAKSKRKIRAKNGPFFYSMHVSYARHCLVFVIVTTYSTMNPLILPFGLIYYGFTYLVARHNLVFVYKPQHTSEGDMFPAIFTRLMWGLLLYQLVMAAVMGLAQFIAAVAIFVLLILTFLFWWWTDKQMHHRSKYGVLSQLDIESDPFFCDMDEHLDEDLIPGPDTYKSIILRTPLFQMEDQTTEEDYETNFWWPQEWVDKNYVEPEEVVADKEGVEKDSTSLNGIKGDFSKSEVPLE